MSLENWQVNIAIITKQNGKAIKKKKVINFNCPFHIYLQRHISRIYKETLQLNNDKKITPLKMGNKHFSEDKQPMSTLMFNIKLSKGKQKPQWHNISNPLEWLK